MIIAISGGTGFIGTHLIQDLVRRKHTVLQLTRMDFDPQFPDRLYSRIAQADAVINLAGVSIMKRWNKKNREDILNSRIEITKQIVQALKRRPEKPCTLISMSAVGIYPMNGGIYDERYQGKAKGFLANVCRRWEEEARTPPPHRTVILRSGLVLHPDGGVLKKMLTIFKAGAPFQVGLVGKQPFSWISLEDLIRIINTILWDNQMTGIYNCVVPEAYNYSMFSRSLSFALGRGGLILLPKWIFYVFLGKRASLLCKGSFIIPKRLISIGFDFKSQVISEAVFRQLMQYPLE